MAARRFTPEPTLLQSLAGPLSRLLWASLADVPQTYHVVKALCILCTWPLPISSTSTDPTFMLSGVMMQVAMQIGLHRPSHAQDFTKFRVELRAEELRDRVKTWAACNVVAQRYLSPGLGVYLRATNHRIESPLAMASHHLASMIGPLHLPALGMKVFDFRLN